jgi:nucleotidyltransferase/DNA polymerase involved in DNA repair
MTIIGHLDMDAFFAAVEERENPRLKGRAIVVGADPQGGKGRGVVATANYKARKYGIHSAMPISKAWRLAEEGRQKEDMPVVFMQGGFSKYSEVSGKIMAIIRRHTEHVEEASIDEAYFDLSNARSYAEAARLARKIKINIRNKERLTASIGIGPNKMIAKIASDMEKPDGFTVIGTDEPEACSRIVQEFLAPLAIRKIPGIGPKTELALQKQGIATIAHLQALSKAGLKKQFGKWGEDLYQKARGLASAEIIEAWTVKSIGEQVTFETDTLDARAIARCLEELAADITARFKRSRFTSFRTIVLTVRFEDFTTKTRSYTLERSCGDPSILAIEGLRLVMPFLDSRENLHRQKLRLLGLRMEKLS